MQPFWLALSVAIVSHNGQLNHSDPWRDHYLALKACITGHPEDWKHKTGRPRRSWLRTVDLCLLNCGTAMAKRHAQDRLAWWLLVTHTLSFSLSLPLSLGHVKKTSFYFNDFDRFICFYLPVSLLAASTSSRHADLSQLPKCVTLQLPGQNWHSADCPPLFSARFASVLWFCVASLWEEPECRPEELGNGLDWCRHDKGDQRKTGWCQASEEEV